MPKIDPATRDSWRKNPDARVGLILHVTGDVTKRTQALSARGVKVTRQFRLTQTVAIRTVAAEALKLLRLAWITRIEPDGPVSALRR